MAEELLGWIYSAIDRLKDVRFPNTLGAVQRLQVQFKEYRTTEKPPKFVDKGMCDFGLITEFIATQVPHVFRRGSRSALVSDPDEVILKSATCLPST